MDLEAPPLEAPGRVDVAETIDLTDARAGIEAQARGKVVVPSEPDARDSSSSVVTTSVVRNAQTDASIPLTPAISATEPVWMEAADTSTPQVHGMPVSQETPAPVEPASGGPLKTGKPKGRTATRSKTKCRPRRRLPVTPPVATMEVYDPDFVPDPPKRPKRRGFWHDVSDDSADQRKEAYHFRYCYSASSDYMRLCLGKQPRVSRIRSACRPRSHRARPRCTLSALLRRLLAEWCAGIDLHTSLEHQAPPLILLFPVPSPGRQHS